MSGSGTTGGRAGITGCLKRNIILMLPDPATWKSFFKNPVAGQDFMGVRGELSDPLQKGNPGNFML